MEDGPEFHGDGLAGPVNHSAGGDAALDGSDKLVERDRTGVSPIAAGSGRPKDGIREQGPVGAGVVVAELHVGVGAAGKRVERVGSPGFGGGERLVELIEELGGSGAQQVGLVGEVGIDARRGDATFGGDRAHAYGVSVAGPSQQLRGGVEDLMAELVALAPPVAGSMGADHQVMATAQRTGVKAAAASMTQASSRRSQRRRSGS